LYFINFNPMAREPDLPSLSRRKWLGLTPTIAAASVGSGLLAGRVLADEPKAAPPGGEESLRGAKTYNIRDFGAQGDGKTLDTAALQAAIDSCHQERGGTVVVPAGVFVIGTVELKSNSRCTLQRKEHCSAPPTKTNTMPPTKFLWKAIQRSRMETLA
jgi:Pectate lyase superfamily protein